MTFATRELSRLLGLAEGRIAAGNDRELRRVLFFAEAVDRDLEQPAGRRLAALNFAIGFACGWTESPNHWAPTP